MIYYVEEVIILIMKRNNYTEKSRISQSILNTLQKQSQKLSFCRLFVFLGLTLSVGLVYDQKQPWLLLLSLAILLSFFFLIQRHSQVFQKQLDEQNRQKVYQQYIARLTNQWHDFPDKGEDFLQREQPQDVDLNILGQDSFFQYCNCARSAEGRALLAQRLSPTPPTPAEVQQRQLYTQYFMDHPELALELQAIAQDIPQNHSLQKLLTYLGDTQNKSLGLVNKLSFGLPILLIASILGAWGDFLPMAIPGAFISLQIILTLASFNKNGQHFEPLYRLNKELLTYYRLLENLEPHYEQLPVKPVANLSIAKILPPLRTLGRICSFAENRHNFLLLFILNGLFLYDFHLLRYSFGWQKQYGSQLEQWLKIWQETEVALSLAVVGQCQEQVTMAEYTTTGPVLEAQGIINPLLPQEQAVSNDVAFQASLNIITGSNMSGKTTLLRTLALSCILTYAGAPVCGQHFKLSPLHIFTSIRVNDNLAQGISTFYAELLRIRQMIEFSQQKQPMLLCIDEIFKGTNSADRILGAETALRRLTAPWIIALVSTHDFELCQLTTPAQVPVNNFHFAESYSQDKILFDYKIKSGPCTTTNAQYLLKMAGIIQ